MIQLPEKFCDEMKRILGEEYPAYLDSMEQTRKYGLRVNTAKISVEEFEKICPFPIRKIPFVDNGFFYDEDVQPAKHPFYFAGLYYLQDPSAMTPASRLPINEGDVVLDLCAAPGGKATELAAKLKGTGLLIANDISAKRAKALLKNIELFGVENSFIVTEYPHKLAEYFTGFFDKILIDAPCSGEGMFRKDPSMVKAWEQNGPEFYRKLQQEILEDALPMLKPGGMLLYSTCTFSPLEDEGTVDFVLSHYPDISLVEMEGYEGFVCGKPELVDGSVELKKTYRIFPHKMDGEGHYLALFKKSEDADEPVMVAREERAGLKGEEKRVFEEFMKSFHRSFDSHRLESKNGMIYYMPKELPAMKGLRFLRSGLFMGECKKNRFEPSQSLAMALKKEDVKNRIDLKPEDERVIRYLKGETLTLLPEDITGEENGWYLVCVGGFPLGWGKRAGLTLKNKYHSGWRML